MSETPFYIRIVETLLSNMEWWQFTILISIVSISSIYILIYKNNIKPTNLFGGKEIESLRDKLNTCEKETENIITKIDTVRKMEHNLNNSIECLKSYYVTMIERDTDTNLLKMSNVLDSWFNSKLLKESSDTEISDRCEYCKRKSFYAASNYLALSLKDLTKTAFIENGFLEMVDSDFNRYLENKKILFRKKIEDVLRSYYIIQKDVEKYYDNLQNSSLEYTLKEIDTLVEHIFKSMKDVETTLFRKIKEEEDNHNNELTRLFSN